MNLKALIEKRNELTAAMQKLIDTANTETRALTNDELADFERMKAEIADLDKTIAACKEMRALENTGDKEPMAAGTKVTKAAREELESRAFEAYIRGVIETRDDPADEPVNMTKGDNGAVIPTTTARTTRKSSTRGSPTGVPRASSRRSSTRFTRSRLSSLWLHDITWAELSLYPTTMTVKRTSLWTIRRNS